MSDCRCSADRDTARVLTHIQVWHGRLTDDERADLRRVSNLLHRIADEDLATTPTTRRPDQGRHQTEPPR